jgi:choline dehydrogenase
VNDLFFVSGIEAPAENGYDVSVAVFAMKPASHGSVRLTSRDPRAPLAIDHGFLFDPQDAEILAEGVEALRRVTGADPIRSYGGRETRPGPEVEAVTHVREAARGFFLPVATCAIGRVVDGDGRVYGFDGLFVADASIMPTIPQANTNLSTIALAERLAQASAAEQHKPTPRSTRPLDGRSPSPFPGQAQPSPQKAEDTVPAKAGAAA